MTPQIKFSLALFFLILSPTLADWTPVDWRTLPLAKEEHKINVYYLVAPLLEERFKDALSLLGLYHGAIAFENENTNFSVTINYEANDIFRSSLFPNFVITEEGQRVDLSWLNGGAVFVYKGLNNTYWSEKHHVSTISGAMYNKFMAQFNANINVTHPYYNMFALMDSWNGTTYVPSWDCFDYVWASFQELNDMGAVFHNETKIKRNFANIYSAVKPVNVTQDYKTNAAVRRDIIDFYSLLEMNVKKMSLKELIVEIFKTTQGNFYYRTDESYWRLKLNWPIFGVYWGEAPIIDCDKNLLFHRKVLS